MATHTTGEADSATHSAVQPAAGSEYVSDVELEQHELELLLDEVRRIVHGDQRCKPPLATRLVELLDELCERLGMVFALKETGGYLEDVVLTAPPLSERAEALRSEHLPLFGELCRLIAQCDDDFEHRRWRHLRTFLETSFDDFCRRFQAHQAGEAELVQRAFTDDVGVGD
ncbi:MAG: hypothetical protein WD278_05525 [Pirellulales bacterium]